MQKSIVLSDREKAQSAQTFSTDKRVIQLRQMLICRLQECTQVVDALEINRLVDPEVEYASKRTKKHVLSLYASCSRKALKLIFSKTKPSSTIMTHDGWTDEMNYPFSYMRYFFISCILFHFYHMI